MNAIGYLRVSTDEQGQSLITQEAAIRRWAESLGHTLIQIYRDEGVSGGVKPMDRPGCRAAIEHANRTGMLVVAKLDRISRNVRHILELIDEGLGDASLISISESFDASTPNGRMFTTMLGSFAEFERGRMKERINEGFATCRRLGRKMGGDVPYGYTAQDGLLVVNPVEHKVFKVVEVLRGKGMSWDEVAKELNRRGYRRREGKAWSRHIIWRMVGSEEKRRVVTLQLEDGWE